MDNVLTIRKRQEVEGGYIEKEYHAEEIENGWIVTLRECFYPERDDEDDMVKQYKEETRKKYYKTNPFNDKPVWDSFEK